MSISVTASAGWNLSRRLIADADDVIEAKVRLF